MKKVCLLAFAALAVVASADYPRYGVRLMSHIGLADLPGGPSSAAAIYGYVSPSGREYATVGIRNGTAIIEITNPTQPVTVAHIPGPSSLWHENVVLGNYCYAVTDATGVGIHIINLTNVDSGSVTLDAIFDDNALMSTVHTIEGDVATKRLFANGGSRNFAVLDATNPTSLVEVGRWTDHYVHDSVIKNFTSGPFAGHQIGFLCCGTSGLYIVDLTNPANIQTIGNLNYYPGSQNDGKFYCHSASLTPDNHYLLVNDEFDENQGIASSCTTMVVDVSNLASPQVATAFHSGINTIDHNSNLRDGFLFLSAYKAGVRIYNAADPLHLSETGFLDTYPSATDHNSYNGDWGVFARFPSKNVVLSDIDDGFFVVDPTEAMGLGASLVSSNLSTIGGSGTLADLRESDNHGAGLPSLANPLIVFAETNISPRTKLSVKLEGRGGTSVNAYLRNQITHQFDFVGSRILGTTDTTLSVSNLPSATYVTSNGQIEAKFVGAGFSANPAATRVVIDMVRFDVTP